MEKPADLLFPGKKEKVMFPENYSLWCGAELMPICLITSEAGPSNHQHRVRLHSGRVWLMQVRTSCFSAEARKVGTIGEDGIFSPFCSPSNFSTLVVVVGASFPMLPLAYYKPRTDCLSCSQQGNRFCCRSCFSIKVLQEGRRSWWYWRIRWISGKKGRSGFRSEPQSPDVVLLKREKT